MNIVFTPVRLGGADPQGEMSGQLLRPLHPIHYDLGYFAGWKVVVIVLWLPIAAVLSLVFRPELDPSLAGVPRVLPRDLGRVPDPVAEPVGARGW